VSTKQWGNSSTLYKLYDPNGGASKDALIFTVDTSIAGATPLGSFEYNLSASGKSATIYWGDGTSDVKSNNINITHVYPSPGIYTIAVTGTWLNQNMNNIGDDNNKVIALNQWGTNQIDSANNMWFGCNNMIMEAKDNPDVSISTNFTNFFRGCHKITYIPSDHPTWMGIPSNSNIAQIFRDCFVLTTQLDVTNWYVARTNLSQMFRNCYVMPTPIGIDEWDTTNSTNMSQMFNSAFLMDPDVSQWNISLVTNFSSFANDSGFSTTNYDKLLDPTTGWPSQTLQTAQTPNFGSTQYSAGDPTTGRGILTGAPNLWVISDGGQVP
jgi:hypothetical protein